MCHRQTPRRPCRRARCQPLLSMILHAPHAASSLAALSWLLVLLEGLQQQGSLALALLSQQLAREPAAQHLDSPLQDTLGFQPSPTALGVVAAARAARAAAAAAWRAERRSALATLSDLRICAAAPLFGRDLVRAVSMEQPVRQVGATSWHPGHTGTSLWECDDFRMWRSRQATGCVAWQGPRQKSVSGRQHASSTP